jgi:hypothetical protein
MVYLKNFSLVGLVKVVNCQVDQTEAPVLLKRMIAWQLRKQSFLTLVVMYLYKH